jgi:hypothetical protein
MLGRSRPYRNLLILWILTRRRKPLANRAMLTPW